MNKRNVIKVTTILLIFMLSFSLNININTGINGTSSSPNKHFLQVGVKEVEAFSENKDFSITKDNYDSEWVRFEDIYCSSGEAAIIDIRVKYSSEFGLTVYINLAGGCNHEGSRASMGVDGEHYDNINQKEFEIPIETLLIKPIEGSYYVLSYSAYKDNNCNEYWVHGHLTQLTVSGKIRINNSLLNTNPTLTLTQPTLNSPLQPILPSTKEVA